MAGSTSNVLQLIATLSCAPQLASDGGFPSAVTSIPFALNTGDESKPAPVDSGAQYTALNSAAAFVELAGIGPGKSVPLANTLYVRTDAAIDIRTTTAGNVVAVHKVTGVFMIEADDDAIVKLEAQGVGSIEWFASGATS